MEGAIASIASRIENVYFTPFVTDMCRGTRRREDEMRCMPSSDDGFERLYVSSNELDCPPTGVASREKTKEVIQQTNELSEQVL